MKMLLHKEKHIKHLRLPSLALACILAISILISGCDIENYAPDIDYSSLIRHTDEIDITKINPEMDAYEVVNNNEPFFTDEEITDESYEKYSPLDYLGRCGAAMSCVGRDLMPTEKRGEIGMVRPSGWKSIKYNGVVEGNSLYTRAHLIGYMLTAENANEENLITGTRYMNVQGMLPFEIEVANYVRYTDNHVMYRVTPVFEGTNPLASGVLMEAYSVEDKGEGVKFCVYCYNIQPMVEINYKTSESKLTPEGQKIYDETLDRINHPDKYKDAKGTYIINTNNMKFHLPSCSSVTSIRKENRKTYEGSRGDLIDQGYSPCKSCNP